MHMLLCIPLALWLKYFRLVTIFCKAVASVTSGVQLGAPEAPNYYSLLIKTNSDVKAALFRPF